VACALRMRVNMSAMGSVMLIYQFLSASISRNRAAAIPKLQF
jgi:hypothetical protein